MNKKTLLYVAGAVAVVGIVVWYSRSQAKKRALANAKVEFEPETDEEASNIGGQQVGTMSCTSPNENLCKSSCERMGGTYNEYGDRTCWKNGQPITGGGFGTSRVSRKVEMR